MAAGEWIAAIAVCVTIAGSTLSAVWWISSRITGMSGRIDNLVTISQGIRQDLQRNESRIDDQDKRIHKLEWGE